MKTWKVNQSYTRLITDIKNDYLIEKTMLVHLMMLEIGPEKTKKIINEVDIMFNQKELYHKYFNLLSMSVNKHDRIN